MLENAHFPTDSPKDDMVQFGVVVMGYLVGWFILFL
jgi:hypothetical protein